MATHLRKLSFINPLHFGHACARFSQSRIIGFRDACHPLIRQLLRCVPLCPRQDLGRQNEQLNVTSGRADHSVYARVGLGLDSGSSNDDGVPN